MRRVEDSKDEKLYVKCTLIGEPARIVRELKARGLASSIREIVVLGIICLYDRVLERDLKRAQVQASQRLDRGLKD